MASTMLVARPSCRKCCRSDTRQSGVVRNSVPVAEPCTNPSASAGPMSCTKRSVYGRIVVGTGPALPGPGISGLWQVAQPVLANSAAPGDGAEGVPMHAGVGGSMVSRNATSDVNGAPSASGWKNDAPHPLTRSRGANGFVMPSSSRNASPMNSTSVAVCAFHPKRPTRPSARRFSRP